MPNSEIVKGYEFEKGRYVVMSEEDFDKVRPESTRVIDLVQFADESAIDPMYVDRTYYLAPDGGMAADAFAVMRDGMKGKVGIGKLALYGREYLVAVRPHERGIVMHTLHHAAEIRGIDSVEELNSVPTKVKPEEIKLAQAGDRDLRGAARPADYKDEYREGLQRIIDAKIAGEEVVAPAVEAPPKVVNLMDALRKSLDAVSAQKKKPAKAAAEKPAARSASAPEELRIKNSELRIAPWRHGVTARSRPSDFLAATLPRCFACLDDRRPRSRSAHSLPERAPPIHVADRCAHRWQTRILRPRFAHSLRAIAAFRDEIARRSLRRAPLRSIVADDVLQLTSCGDHQPLDAECLRVSVWQKSTTPHANRTRSEILPSSKGGFSVELTMSARSMARPSDCSSCEEVGDRTQIASAIWHEFSIPNS